MKVNLLLDGRDVRSGYVNIDPFAAADTPGLRRGDVSTLDEFADAEIDELIAADVMDYLPASSIDAVFDVWLRKIRHGGSIVVGGTDIREVARGVVGQTCDVDHANRLIYGDQTSPWQYRKATTTLRKVVEVFQGRGFKIISKRIKDYHYEVRAERS